MDLTDLTNTIVSLYRRVLDGRSLLVGISGIDASGKGYIASQLATSMPDDLSVAIINADEWLNLPAIRFSDTDPARHFYENALRLDEMFESLIVPLKQNAKVDLIADFLEETSKAFQPQRYFYKDVDVILLEGIFLFKRKYVSKFDLRIWIDCSFEIALQRAIARSQEGLSTDETINAYENIYFPAQRLHFAVDQPHMAADLLFNNG